MAVLTIIIVPNAVRAAPKIRVRGASALSARVIPRVSGLEVRGVLKDDSGRPIGQAHVRAQLRTEAGPRRLPAPSACGTTTGRELHAAGDEVVVDTDGAGALCFLLPEPGLSGRLVLSFEGDPLYSRSQSEIDVDSSRRSLSLRFSPEPRVLSLDRAEQSIWVETRVEPPLDSADVVEPVQLELSIAERGGSSHTASVVVRSAPASAPSSESRRPTSALRDRQP